MTIALIITILLLLLAAWVVSTQKRLVKCDETSKNALSQIGVQLDARWGALLALAKTASQYATHEKETLVKTIEMRRPVQVSMMHLNDIRDSETQLGNLLGRLNMLQEQYPNLKADTLFQQQMRDIDRYENMVRTSRMVYNDAVTIKNRLVRQLPSSIVAAMFGFSTDAYIDLPSNPALANNPLAIV
ncbi:MAG: LemA family protein [Bacteroidales bacterium]|nr:LemA family protein [Bacteroidales bacterium]